jgi:hypothetical protein
MGRSLHGLRRDAAATSRSGPRTDNRRYLKPDRLADEQGLLDGIAALNDLRQTTFRAAPELLERFEARMQARQD